MRRSLLESVAIGVDALQNAVQNYANTAVGAFALQNSTQNANIANTAIGHDAGGGGELSGTINDGGNTRECTFIGAETGVVSSHTAVSYGAAIGSGALIFGSNTTMLGGPAGSGADTVTIMSSATIMNLKTGLLQSNATGYITAGNTLSSSSYTFANSGGLGVTYGVNIGSMTGAGLTSCSGGSNAVTWNSGTNLFGCNTISGGGGSTNGTITASPQFQVPYYSLSGTTTTLTGAQSFTTDGSSVTVSTMVSTNLVEIKNQNHLLFDNGAYIFNQSGGGLAQLTLQASNGVTISNNLSVNGNLSGGGLTGCSASNSAVTYSTTTGQFGCNTISGSGGGGGYNLQPSTVTINANFGITVTTITVSSNTILPGTTFYANGQAVINGVNSSTWLTGNQTITLSGDVTGSGATSIATTAAAQQTHITTLSASSVTVTGSLLVSSNTLIAGATFYQNGTIVLGTPGAQIIVSTNILISGVTFYNQITPGLIAGTKITSITGFWPNQTINAATQGGGGGGGYAVQPATVPFILSQSVTASSMTVSSNTYLSGDATFYATAPIFFGSGLSIAATNQANILQLSTATNGVTLVSVSSTPATAPTDYLLNISSSNGQQIITAQNNGAVTISTAAALFSANFSSFTISASSTSTATIFANTGLACTITPRSTSSLIKITVMGTADDSSAAGDTLFTIARGNTNLAVGGTSAFSILSLSVAGGQTPVSFGTIDNPSTISPVTYNVQQQLQGSGNAIFCPNAVCVIICEEEH